jgi:alkaline phosphatase D
MSPLSSPLALPLLSPLPRAAALPEFPFTLGVASGEPRCDGALLWTRLAPRPLAELGGMTGDTRVVRWEVASDDAFRHVVARGTALARAEHAHSVHAAVHGLRAGGVYWYRFDVGGHLSPAGLLRTTPSRDCLVESVMLAVAAPCEGRSEPSTELSAAARDDLELLVMAVAPFRIPVSDEEDALGACRRAYARMRLDPHLQAVQRRVTSVVAEVAPLPSMADDAVLRAARARAAWEHAPLSPHGLVHASAVSWGQLVDVSGRSRRVPERGTALPWGLHVHEAHVELVSRYRPRALYSDIAAPEDCVLRAVRALTTVGAGYLRCEVARDWARWETIGGGA